MNAEKEREQFMSTGRVSDYLCYKNRENEEQNRQAGEQLYAGFRNCNGDGNQNDTCRRI